MAADSDVGADGTSTPGETAPTQRVSQRVYVVGDVHGCFEELLHLEDVARTDARAHDAEAFFVSVGDLVDRGPRIRDVVVHVRDGVRAGTHACVGGNHEALLAEAVLALAPWNFERGWPLVSARPAYAPGLDLRFLLEGSPAGLSMDEFKDHTLTRWLRCGGRQTLVSFGCEPEEPKTWEFDADLLAFLVGLPLMWENDRAVVTHALATRAELDLGRKLARRAEADPAGFHASLTPREARVLDGLLWRREEPGETPSPGRLHVTGHTPVETPRLDTATGVANVDTACVFGNALTALCLDDGRFLSVPGWKASPYA